jgi:hypothetical protein
VHAVPPLPPSCHDQHPCQQAPGSRVTTACERGLPGQARCTFASSQLLHGVTQAGQGICGAATGAKIEPPSRPSAVCWLAGRIQLVAACSGALPMHARQRRGILGACAARGAASRFKRAPRAAQLPSSCAPASLRGLGSRVRAAEQQRQGSCPLSYKAATTLQAAGTAFATAAQPSIGSEGGMQLPSPCDPTGRRKQEHTPAPPGTTTRKAPAAMPTVPVSTLVLLSHLAAACQQASAAAAAAASGSKRR